MCQGMFGPENPSCVQRPAHHLRLDVQLEIPDESLHQIKPKKNSGSIEEPEGLASIGSKSASAFESSKICTAMGGIGSGWDSKGRRRILDLN
jgi:hypothetical protein